MKKVFKKALSFSLALLLIFTIIPLGTFEAGAATVANKYTFNTVYDTTVSTYSPNYDMTINIFGRQSCPNGETVIRNLIQGGVHELKNVQINYIDFDYGDKATVKALADVYSKFNINFCYDLTGTAYNALWEYAYQAGAGNSIATPLTVFIKSDGTLFKATQGAPSVGYLLELANGDDSGEAIVNISVTGDQNYDYAYDILNQLNALRASQNQPALKMDESLLNCAMQRAAEIGIYYSHTRPNGTKWSTVLSNTGSYYGENIAIGYRSTDSVMNGWTNSSGHYKNMVESRYTSVGIGCFKTSDGTWCWVQNFSNKTANEVWRSGEVTATHTFPAKKMNLLAYISAGMDTHRAGVGATSNFSVCNYNTLFGATQIINTSSFDFSSSNSNVLEITGGDGFRINGSGKTMVTATFKGTSAKLIEDFTVGHVYTNDADTTCDYCDEKAYPGGNTLVYEGGSWYHVVNRKKVNDTTLVKYNNAWYYVKNGKVDFNATTVIKYGGTWYYVNKGVVDFKANTLCNYAGSWWYVKNGMIDFKANTLCKYGSSWYYVKNGKVDFNTTTLFKFGSNWYYVRNGVVDFKARTAVKYGGTWYFVNKGMVDFKASNTLCEYAGSWWYVKNGMLDFKANTLCKYDGTWYYVKNGKVDFKATTLFKYDGKWYYVRNGVVDFKSRTVVNYDGTWYFVNKGTIDLKANNTLASYAGSWWYIRNGTIDFKANTLCKYGGTWYRVINGKVDFKQTTLYKYGGTWYYLRNGMIDFKATTVVKYGNTWYYVKNGMVDFKANNTLCEYAGSWWYIKNGMIDFNAKTLCKYGGTWYYIKNGKWVKDTTLVKYGGTWYYVKGGIVNFKYSGKVLYNGRYYIVRNGIVK